MWRFEHTGVDLTKFDEDGDGVFDCLVVMHSGAAAETNGNDCKLRESRGPSPLFTGCFKRIVRSLLTMS